MLPDELSLEMATRRKRRYIEAANFGAQKIRDLEEFPGPKLVRPNAFINDCVREGGDYPGVGLLIYGNPGCGKTSLAKTILRNVLTTAPPAWLGEDRFTAMRPGYFISHTGFLQKHYDSYKDGEYSEHARALLRGLKFEAMHRWENTRVLVLDDAGKENPLAGTGHKSQVMHDTIRGRYHLGAPTIITTNVRPTEWAAVYGDATASFLREAFIEVDLSGPDRRNPQ